MVNKLLRNCVILGIVIAVSGCQSVKKHITYASGEHAEHLRKIENSPSGLENATPDDLQLACIGYYEVKRYNKFEDCFALFMGKYSNNVDFDVTQLRARGKGDFVAPLLVAKANVHIDFDEPKLAIKWGERALAILIAETKSALGDTRDRTHIEALGVLGHAHAL